MAKKVTVINAISESTHTQPQQRLKVCAYARVSTGSRVQAESYATQVEYYAEKIENNPLWEFAGVYADEGITGTKVKGRDDFKAMIAACEEGDIEPDQVHNEICQKYGGMHTNHPKIKGNRCGDLF